MPDILSSSNANYIFAGAFFLSFFFRKLWFFFYLTAFLVGYSRVCLGVHFPFDVLGGAVAGTACGTLYVWPASAIINFFKRRSGKKSAEKI